MNINVLQMRGKCMSFISWWTMTPSYTEPGNERSSKSGLLTNSNISDKCPVHTSLPHKRIKNTSKRWEFTCNGEEWDPSRQIVYMTSSTMRWSKMSEDQNSFSIHSLCSAPSIRGAVIYANFLQIKDIFSHGLFCWMSNCSRLRRGKESRLNFSFEMLFSSHLPGYGSFYECFSVPQCVIWEPGGSPISCQLMASFSNRIVFRKMETIIYGGRVMKLFVVIPISFLSQLNVFDVLQL